jgi:hypothetical protein
MMMTSLQEMQPAEYEAAIARFLEEAAEWDGTLPIDTFMQTWDAIEQRRETLHIRAQLIQNRLVLRVPPESPLTVIENRIQLEDGRELVIDLQLLEETAF